jgi:CopA family copper-resistance protein
MMTRDELDRRTFFQRAAALGIALTAEPSLPLYARSGQEQASPYQAPPNGERSVEDGRGGNVITLTIDGMAFLVNGRRGSAIAINGSIPGPLLRLREGEEATIRVTNRLRETSSIHWHGLIVPPDMDGVPGVSFAGIRPGETFEYRFPVRQNGTYWCHSHSGGQELLGVYAPIIIDPAKADPVSATDRDYVVMLSDYSFESPMRILQKLKKQANYYNYQKRTAETFFADVRKFGWKATVRDRQEWAKMRMDPTDFADVTGFTNTYLMNGRAAQANWTALFTPGQKVRLRFINAASMTYFDLRVPGLKLTVVAADGQAVQPVTVDEFRIAPAETFDVLVEPNEDRAYTVFAESMDRSGYARGTLAPRAGMVGAMPERRPRPLRTMADMGMAMGMNGMGGMDMKGMPMPDGKKSAPAPPMDHSAMPGMAMPDKGASSSMKERDMKDMGGVDMHGMNHETMKAMAAKQKAPSAAQKPGMAMPGMKMPDKGASQMPIAAGVGALRETSPIPGSAPVMHDGRSHGPGNSTIPMATQSRLSEPGSGLDDTGTRVLVYTDLKRVTPREDRREPEREVELHLTGNMERYIWGFDGKKYSEAQTPIAFRYGERLRLTLVNDTMMEHPIHLHGMWMELENGHGDFIPRKHTISVKPAERVSLAITADAPGQWAFHCHLLLHMELGMFRVVEVSAKRAEAAS